MKRLCRHGERISDHAIASDPGLVGHITLVLVENVPVMKLHGSGDDAVQKPILPLMWRAKVVMIRGEKVLYQGFEHTGTAGPEEQEWSVQVMVEPPAELAGTSHRPP